MADPRIQVVEPGQLELDVEANTDAPVIRMIGDARPESTLKRRVFLLIALAFTAGLWFFLFSFLAPAPGRVGVDENAYLVGGRMLAEHGTTGFKPSDDYQFVGAMWVRTKSGWYYPKYPFGTSLLNAVTVLLGRREWAFAIGPASTCLAVLGMFFLSRAIVGSFYALLAMIVLAMGPTTLGFAILPDSHAPALCVVVWGIYFLLRWWEGGRWQWGVAAGLLLGFAVTIRYTEALLLFPLYPLDVIRTDGFISPKVMSVLKVFGFLPIGPIGIAAMSRVKNWKSWRSYLPAAVPVIAWGVPVGALVIFNWFTVGHATGYDGTNESSGFALKYFFEKWDFTVYQLYLWGLFIFAPLGIAGLILIFRSNWRTAMLLTMWFVPGTLLYTSYYWGDNVPGVLFLRFFLTLFPPLIIAAMYLLRSAGDLGKGSIASPLAAGVLTACAVAVGLSVSIDDLIRQHRGNMNLHYSAREIISHIKPSSGGKPMILADEGMFPLLLQYMQFMYDADWYQSDIFAPRMGGGFGLAGVFEKRKSTDDTPSTLQSDRIDYIDSIRKGKTDTDFIADAHRLMDEALNAGRRVYVILPPTEQGFFRHRFITGAYEMVEVNKWSEPCNVQFPGSDDHNALAPSVMPDNMVILPWHPVSRAMFEIRRPPATQPTS
ncbi:MAG TPA: glycosyltransferase family 39 protein [Tepidisphaeraceae bacterium]|nr:glycosyltransferase family 39 protein [Tepidisphaeraceae bacterium]